LSKQVKLLNEDLTKKEVKLITQKQLITSLSTELETKSIELEASRTILHSQISSLSTDLKSKTEDLEFAKELIQMMQAEIESTRDESDQKMSDDILAKTHS